MKKESKIAGAALILVAIILVALYVLELINSHQNEASNPAQFAYSTVAYGGVPAHGAVVKTTTVDLGWWAGKLATSHTVYVHANMGLVKSGDSRALLTETKETTVKASDLKPDTTYYWRVDAVSAAAVAVGNAMHFTILSDTHITPGDDPNLIGWWKADEPATALGMLDHSGHGLHAALQGNATWIEGAVDRAVEMDGRSTFQTLKTPNAEVTEATLCAWIRPKGMCTDNAGIVFCRGSRASGLNLTQGNELGYHWNNNQTSYNYRSGLIVPKEAWSFIAMVIEPNKARFYVNDLKAPATNAVPHAASALDAPINLGRDPHDVSRSFDGALDDMRFYQKALSPDELAEIRDYTGKIKS